jgi:hypothetical protein
MPGEVRIYFEGDKSLKAGFDVFLREIRERANAAQYRVVATGGTPERDFGIALRKHPAAWNILLRDSEGPWNEGLQDFGFNLLEGGNDGGMVPRR